MEIPCYSESIENKNLMKYLGSNIEEEIMWEIGLNGMKEIGKLRNLQSEEILEVHEITSTPIMVNECDSLVYNLIFYYWIIQNHDDCSS